MIARADLFPLHVFVCGDEIGRDLGDYYLWRHAHAMREPELSNLYCIPSAQAASAQLRSLPLTLGKAIV